MKTNLCLLSLWLHAQERLAALAHECLSAGESAAGGDRGSDPNNALGVFVRHAAAVVGLSLPQSFTAEASSAIRMPNPNLAPATVMHVPCMEAPCVSN